VGEEVLEGSHLPPLPLLNGLYDPVLEPAHNAARLGELALGPGPQAVGSCTRIPTCRLPRLPGRKARRSRRRDPREVSPLSRGVMWPPPLRPSTVLTACGATPIRPVTGRHSLAPSSFTRPSAGVPCGRLSPPAQPEEERTGLPRSAGKTSVRLGALYPPAALGVRGRRIESFGARCSACWLRPESSLSRFWLTTVRTRVRVGSPC
jgi:hypothetical protein